jgi:homoserine O-acetyltransferase/O-succinyltransferase
MITNKIGFLSKLTAVGMCKPVTITLIFAVLIALTGVLEVAAQSTGKEGSYVIRNFMFKSGETLEELRINYGTWGEPKKDNTGNITNAVLLCHGTGSRWQFLVFPSGLLLRLAGQPLDNTQYFVIASDAIGSDKSSKPSDGLRMKFPK